MNPEILRQRILANQPVSDAEIAEAIKYLRENRESAMTERKKARATKGIQSPAEVDTFLDDIFGHLKPTEEGASAPTTGRTDNEPK